MYWHIDIECISLVIFCIIFVYARRRNFVPTLKNKLFHISLIVTFLAMTSNIISTIFIYNYERIPLLLNWIMCSIYFVITPLMGIIYFYYVLSIVYEKSSIPRAYLLTSIPALIYLLLVIFNPLTKNIFNLNLEEGYTQGKYILLMYIIPYVYCLACIVLVFIKRKVLDSRVRNILIIFPFIVIIFIFIQGIFNKILLTGFAAVCSLLIIYLYLQNKQISIDYLTGIPGRREFLEMLELHIKKRKNISLYAVVFSLRGFRHINDKYGYQIGDELLKIIAKYFKEEVNPHVIYRFSGDEFAVLLVNEEKKSIEKLVGSVMDRMKRPWEIKDYNCLLYTSVGIVNYPNTANNVEDIISAIDYSLICAKKDKIKNCYCCTHDMLDEMKRNHRIIEILKDTIDKDAFEVYFQPIWSVKENRFIMAEALIRLNNTPIGPISPVEIISLAENTMFIIEITYQVLNKVCKFINRLISQGIEIESIAINFSGIQFTDEDLVDKTLKIIEKNNIPYNKIKIEVTESILLKNIDIVETFIEKMHEKGIQVALDDFGTGYCNLVSIINTPIDIIKLDKSLVWSSMINQKSAIVMECMTKTIQEIGMKVVAEGVETKEQEEFVRKCGCNWIQGYLYSKPIKDYELEDLLKNNMDK